MKRGSSTRVVPGESIFEASYSSLFAKGDLIGPSCIAVGHRLDIIKPNTVHRFEKENNQYDVPFLLTL